MQCCQERLRCMSVLRSILLIIICGFVVMHASQLGWKSFTKQSPLHKPVTVPGASRPLAKLEHKNTSQTVQRRGAIREMSSAVVTEGQPVLQVSPPAGHVSWTHKYKLVMASRVLTTRLWKITLVILLWYACNDFLARQAILY